jgi:DNA-binding NarL/FixJ family response regulator
MPAVDGHGSTRINRKISMLNNLPDRERMVLAELSRGTGNQQIAARLNLTVSIVKDRVRQILGQLGFRNRTDAGIFAAAYLFDESTPPTTFDDE